MKIHNISAREIIDSRGNPTVSATVELEDGSLAFSSVPSGASTGTSEAFELRDNVNSRFGGKGVLKPVSNINIDISRALVGMEAADQAEIDRKMIELDGTDNKKNMGANAILAVSIAVCRAEAISENMELFEYLGRIYEGQTTTSYTLPTPMFNILNGGKHAENNIDIQETMIVPVGLKKFEEKLRAGAEIYQTLKTELANKGFATGLGDEGGFAPDLPKNESTFEWIGKAIKNTKYTEKQIRISADVASSELIDKGKKTYKLRGSVHPLSSEEMIKLICEWVSKYNLYSVEDGLSEDDPMWNVLTEKMGATISVGDDLFATNPAKIIRGVELKLATGIIIKPNQIGTVTETLDAIREAKKGNFKIIASHRSGETEDTFIADLAVAVGADLIKSGAPARSERLAKYNRLTQIEDYLAENYEE